MAGTTSTPTVTPPTWYRVVSIVAILWMLVGVMAWTADLMTDDAALAKMSEVQRQLYTARPQWLFIVYAVAIFTGLVGAIGLLLRKRWSAAALAISLVAIVIQFGYTFFAMDAIKLLGAGMALPFPIVIFAIGAFLLWLSMRAGKSGWMT